MAFTKINAAGIGTTETVTVDGLTVINDGSFGGNLSVGGTITYEDVTNVDSVGLITARNGIVVGSGITLSKDGDVFFTGIATGNGSGLTALNASNIGSGTVPTARLGSGTASSSTFLRGDSTFQTVNTDLVSDTSPQLGGNLDTNSNNIDFGDSNAGTVNRLRFGASTDLEIFHNGTNNHIDCHTAGQDLYIRPTKDVYFQDYSTDDKLIKMVKDGAVELYHDNSKKFETTSGGVSVTGGINLTTNLSLLDNGYLKLGTGDDLQLYHDGSHSYISDQGTGNLRVLTNTFTVNNAGNSENMINATADGSVQLYHNGTEKFTTQSYGASVDGVITLVKDSADDETSGFQVNGAAMDASGYNYLMSATNDNSTNCLTMFINGSSRTGDGGANGLTIRNDSAAMHLGSRGQANVLNVGASGYIQFEDTTSAVNQLDDYEEGTYTISDASGNGITYTANTSTRYVKIGQAVYVQFDVTTTNVNNLTTQNSRFNIPFAMGHDYGSGVVGWNQMNFQVVMHISSSGAYFMDNSTGNDNTSHLNNTQINNKRFIGSFWYLAST